LGLTGEEKGEGAERVERVVGKEVEEKEVGWVEVKEVAVEGGEEEVEKEVGVGMGAGGRVQPR
jgi:hypothetical protein